MNEFPIPQTDEAGESPTHPNTHPDPLPIADPGLGPTPFHIEDSIMLTLRHSPFDLLERLEQQVRQTDRVPAAEVQETQAAYTVILELPGVDRGSIDVKAGDRSLVISAQRQSQSPAPQNGVAEEPKTNEPKPPARQAQAPAPLHSEFSYGVWSRSFQFPVPLERDGLQARYRDGLLTVTAPKAQTHTPVTVRVED